MRSLYCETCQSSQDHRTTTRPRPGVIYCTLSTKKNSFKVAVQHTLQLVHHLSINHHCLRPRSKITSFLSPSVPTTETDFQGPGWLHVQAVRRGGGNRHQSCRLSLQRLWVLLRPTTTMRMRIPTTLTLKMVQGRISHRLSASLSVTSLPR